MNDLFKFISELTNIAKNKTNITNVPTVIWKNPVQQQEDKIEQTHQQFLKAQQEWNQKK